MPMITEITPFLWFESLAEEAAQFYTGIFKNSRIIEVNRYPASARWSLTFDCAVRHTRSHAGSEGF
jgi:predicted 3-demethylubiquinone-9 3-methyltransferase (glyoxalase superfamily)